MRAVVVAAAASLAIAACAGGSRPELVPVDPTPTIPEGSIAADAEGFIEIGDVRYELNFGCYALDDGSTFLVGEGEDPAGSGPVTGIVRIQPDANYVAVVFGDPASGTAFESTIDGGGGLRVTGQAVLGSDIPFVERSTATGVGVGSVSVGCERFEPGNAADFDF